MSSEWANLVPLDSIQHEQSYFEVGLVNLNWNGTEKTNVSPYCTLCTHSFLEPGKPK